MSAVFGAASAGLPALIGVLLGIRTFTGGWYWVAADVALIAIAYLASAAGSSMMATWPKTGRWFIEAWILSSIGVMALATMVVLQIGLAPLPIWLGTVTGSEETKSVTGAFAGAITTYVALIWTKDIADAKGYFWPSSRFKKALNDLYDRLRPPPANETPQYQVLFDDYIVDEGLVGWDFAGRAKRSALLARFV
ncbi:hypothetical protein [Rhizobium leguminosarum]|uniref:hypothetical protein n=1 Tax=Rhizobium leguminosarum TaxID=384 RepID=UPI001C953B48|nr:hypothetical protein [Rhizobium leguminosarum]MBY5827120.1 hypothetical protein [Rhizobium leguminosarum]